MDSSVGAMAANTLTASALAADAVAEIADGVWDEVFEAVMSARQALRLVVSVLTGKSTGGGGPSPKFRDLADTKDRVSATVDVDGNRTAVTRDVT